MCPTIISSFAPIPPSANHLQYNPPRLLLFRPSFLSATYLIDFQPLRRVFYFHSLSPRNNNITLIRIPIIILLVTALPSSSPTRVTQTVLITRRCHPNFRNYSHSSSLSKAALSADTGNCFAQKSKIKLFFNQHSCCT